MYTYCKQVFLLGLPLCKRTVGGWWSPAWPARWKKAWKKAWGRLASTVEEGTVEEGMGEEGMGHLSKGGRMRVHG